MSYETFSRPSLSLLVKYFLWLGLTGFGGPVALANYMRRDFVERHQWIDGNEYDEGLAIATACPGPLAYQLGVYCGYITHGWIGALSVALSFAAAPFMLVVAVAALYVSYGSNWVLRGIFYGVGPVVIALTIRSCWDLGRKTLRREWLAYGFAVVACAVTVTVQKELTAIFLVGGAVGAILFYKPKPTGIRLASIAPAIVTYKVVAPIKLFGFFLKTGFLVFGSGLVLSCRVPRKYA